MRDIMPAVNVVEFPGNDIADVPRALRKLADDIESGLYGDAHNVAWAVDRGDFEVDVGLAGKAAEPGAVAHMLLAIAQRKLEGL